MVLNHDYELRCIPTVCDRFESIDAYGFERAEVGFAARAAGPSMCADGQHAYTPNGRGGVTCRWRGDYISPEEL